MKNNRVLKECTLPDIFDAIPYEIYKMRYIYTVDPVFVLQFLATELEEDPESASDLMKDVREHCNIFSAVNSPEEVKLIQDAVKDLYKPYIQAFEMVKRKKQKENNKK